MDGLEFGNEEQYAEKLNVIKENYFPKEKSSSDSDKLDDSVDQGALVENTVMARYADSISKAAKFDKVKS